MAKVISLHERLPTESDEQKIVVEYLKARGMMFSHVPNGAKRGFRTASWLKSLGLTKGMPDILIFDRVPKNPDVRGVAIEMKRRKGGVISIEQNSIMERLRECGWLCQVAHGANEAIFWIDSIWH